MPSIDERTVPSSGEANRLVASSEPTHGLAGRTFSRRTTCHRSSRSRSSTPWAVTPTTRNRPRRPATCTQAPTRIPPAVGVPLVEGTAPTPRVPGCEDGTPSGLASVPTTVLVGSAPHAASRRLSSLQELQSWDSTIQGGPLHARNKFPGCPPSTSLSCSWKTPPSFGTPRNGVTFSCAPRSLVVRSEQKGPNLSNRIRTSRLAGR